MTLLLLHLENARKIGCGVESALGGEALKKCEVPPSFRNKSSAGLLSTCAKTWATRSAEVTQTCRRIVAHSCAEYVSKSASVAFEWRLGRMGGAAFWERTTDADEENANMSKSSMDSYDDEAETCKSAEGDKLVVFSCNLCACSGVPK